MRMERGTTIDLYMAIDMLQGAWMDVSASTIANCFRHASFGRIDLGDRGLRLRSHTNLDKRGRVAYSSLGDNFLTREEVEAANRQRAAVQNELGAMPATQRKFQATEPYPVPAIVTGEGGKFRLAQMQIVLWSLMHMEQHVSLIAVETALHEAMLRYNAGCYRATREISASVGLITPGHLALQRAAEKDALRMNKASKRKQEKMEKQQRRKTVRQDPSSYDAGSF
ncbi:hypothetical protein HPB48_008297 [Haemaphysalis longicornis]|uniref:Uncharacterized protein n=1 Tax=Haemaphysalis longicornis TaxID=44386 RepID=A0A9J6FBU0_HAELO|nr:hypothetical protein HPB48_008297 [Haemaphysalis longicornis]